MLVIVCPGQGSQVPGLLTPWLELPGMNERIDAFAAACGTDLRAHGTTSDEQTIRDTAVAQPLIVASGLLALQAIFESVPPLPGVAAISGHSVGEITAAAAAGVLTPEQAMSFVGVRGREMAKASAAHPTGMSAVLGGAPEEVFAAIESHGLTPANVNGAGQVVAAGDLDALAALAENPPAKARVRALAVAGAFHTHYMASAQEALMQEARQLQPSRPQLPLISNADGNVLEDGETALERLVAQVCSPVRWDLCMEQFATLGVTGVLELIPSGTLVGLAKRALKGVDRFAVEGPDSLEAARAFIDAHRDGA
ncbi:ACP S-malonyltransferase [Gephyromycinifex aptenodytis]|uniref:ACP S-malonyltransferase n=1 Tax=Gephyromycinifex aptenodytis TaxID=2716227 RepID=UPI001447DC70|nr:ACP S-malonyltransferase [Gephyromycinifex aptenodytis]